MEEKPHSPHVLIFPFPVQGHINPMLQLAQHLSLAGLYITFLNSGHNHKRLLRYTDIQARFAQYPGFHFKTVSDGLPDAHPRTIDRGTEIFDSLNSSSRKALEEMLIDLRPPVSCIIGDPILGFVSDVAKELKIPLIHFYIASACSFWTSLCTPDVIEAGELPLKGYEDLDSLITTVPGMETFLRGRDLPSFCRPNDINDPIFQHFMDWILKSSETNALILNTFEDLEAPILSHIRTKYPKIYAIGPLDLHLQTKLSSSNSIMPSQSSNSLWEVDKSCMAWLDRQPPQSVVYVSFGSLMMLTREQFMEFWYGLVNSKQRFLWVIRPDSVATDEGERPRELEEGTKERGYIVSWAPQEEVLAHKSVGGFMTHSGWNSTIESLVARVPMICWPCLFDQQVNSRFVSEVWKIGVDMKDVCDRKIVEKMIYEVMVERREEFVKSIDRMAMLAKMCVSDGGSSSRNLNHLVEDLRLMVLEE
ncbi:7-deoxyloganetic acid glucosyltransferase-like [Pistacia vera]|uniref:7-deoxyloganetic acid glucosyltransferase-like n=1 Tax=Pistacia vera TaxID=55513 RepID=UPI001262B2A6|nr:7-deoxyloganetic acid glucosyltransferase-like [Pistacia vera]